MAMARKEIVHRHSRGYFGVRHFPAPAVKTKSEVTPPSLAHVQFFKVKFGE